MSKLRLLLDENIGKRVVAALRERGYDATSVLEDAPGSTDTDVLRRARKEKRLLVTLDKDFGALIFRDSESYVGVLFLRLQNEKPENMIFVLQNILDEYGGKLENRFTTASETDIRIR
ncbi:MAG: DUF5615 family PIN-like protein [bacterium]|nr:DUF5615 family PIN-like protein [bacterium]